VIIHLYPDLIREVFVPKNSSLFQVKESYDAVLPFAELGKNKLIDGFINSLEPFFAMSESVPDELVAVKLQELITILLFTGNKHVRYILGSIQKKEMFEFEKIISENLYNNLSNLELAHLLNRSESSFKREFKKLYGESPAKYKKSKKLNKAAELLRNTSKSISEISWECGFEDLTHFSSSFSFANNMSPRKYRDRHNVL
jgi:AraC family transcriptional regulator, exoenzyme S synthesis regulatory protein ExsA